MSNANYYSQMPSERQTKSSKSYDCSQYITLYFPYGIQINTPLIPHMTCENLLKKVIPSIKANDIFTKEKSKLGIADDRKLTALETANKIESLDCYLTTPDKLINVLRSEDKLNAVMGKGIILN